MATATVSGLSLGGQIYENQYYSVFVKPRWNYPWQFVPYFLPLQSEVRPFNEDSQATLKWEYGDHVNLWGDPGQVLTPLTIRQWILGIMTHTIYGDYWSFIGVVPSDSLESEGENYATGIGTGVQMVRAAGLEYLLTRRRVLGSWTDEVGWVSRTQPYNLRDSRHKGLQGNRGNTVDPSTGVYFHSSDGQVWSNLDIAQNLLTLYQPDEPTWILSGQYSALAYIQEAWDFHALDVRSALAQIIDRKRGLGARIMTDGVGPIYLDVYSLAETAVNLYGYSAPANPVQIDLGFDRDPWVQPVLEITSINQYDQLIVESDQHVKSCFSLNVSGDAGVGPGQRQLEEAWTTNDRQDYLDAEDIERQKEVHQKTFSYLRVRDTFDGSEVTPLIDGNGGINFGTPGHFWRFDKKFLRYLPFDADNGGTGEADKRDCFALVAVPTKVAGTSLPTTVYAYLDRLQGLDLPEASVRPADADLGIWLKARANHVFALNHWDKDAKKSAVEPELDYNTVIFTGFVETDQAIGLTLPVLAGYESPTGKQLYIGVKDMEVWYVDDDTVIDIDNGDLVHYSDWSEYAGPLWRNDMPRLQQLAVMAWIWFGQQRAILNLTIENNLNWFQLGNLVRTAVLGNAAERVGTVVTRITQDYANGRQSIETGYGELDPAEFVQEIAPAGRPAATPVATAMLPPVGGWK